MPMYNEGPRASTSSDEKPKPDPGPRPRVKARFPADQIGFAHVPQELRDTPQWVVWRYELNREKTAWTKVPYRAKDPRSKASTTDARTWATFEEAKATFDASRDDPGDDRIDGIGFIFTADDPFIGIDLDRALIRVGGGTKRWASGYLDRLASYSETSPSGEGVKVIVKGTPPETRGRKRKGLDEDGGAVEIYSRERFFTITGVRLDRWGKAIEERTAEVAALHAELFPPAEKAPRKPAAAPPGPADASDEAILERARKAKNGLAFEALMRGDTAAYHDDDSAADLALCSHLAFWFGGDVDAIDRVFRRSGLYRDKWNREDYRQRTIAKALERSEFYDPNRRRNGSTATVGGNGSNHHAAGETASGEPHVIESDNDPHRLARVVAGDYTDGEGNPLLLYFQDQYHRHDGTCFRTDPFFHKCDLVCKVKAELDRCNVRALARWDGEGKPPTVVRVTRGLVADVNHALASIASVDRPEEPPFWLDPGPDDPDPVALLPARNGLVDLSTDPPAVLPHSPAFFSRSVLPYSYDPDAPEPASWLGLLRAQWPEDQETIDSIHETLGYLLTPDTSMQRIFLWIGPPRSGRGTMREVFTSVIGAGNVASASAIALCGPFGLEPLLGKTVAIMGDARTGDSHDTAVLLDRLLRISGCDPVEVNRKAKVILPDVLMRTRFLIVSNELPNFRDASGAIVSRYHVIQATRTIPPEKRIPDLAKIIVATELPGILNLAIEGRRRLYKRGRFDQPKAAAELIEDAADMASPVKRFVRECYEFVPDATEPTAAVFSEWRNWAAEHGFPCSNDAMLGKNLKSAYPDIRTVRPRTEGRQVCSYQGIRKRIAF